MATRGAVAELLVAANLMAEGFEVFRALSAACSCDLAVLCNGRLVRVEVRTGARRLDGTLPVPYRKADRGRSDVIAVYVRNDNTVSYYKCNDSDGLVVMSYSDFVDLHGAVSEEEAVNGNT